MIHGRSVFYHRYLIWLVIYKLLWIFHIEPYPREVATVDSFFNFHGYTVKTQVVIFLSLFEITGNKQIYRHMQERKTSYSVSFYYPKTKLLEICSKNDYENVISVPPENIKKNLWWPDDFSGYRNEHLVAMGEYIDIT